MYTDQYVVRLLGKQYVLVLKVKGMDAPGALLLVAMTGYLVDFEVSQPSITPFASVRVKSQSRHAWKISN